MLPGTMNGRHSISVIELSSVIKSTSPRTDHLNFLLAGNFLHSLSASASPGSGGSLAAGAVAAGGGPGAAGGGGGKAAGAPGRAAVAGGGPTLAGCACAIAAVPTRNSAAVEQSRGPVTFGLIESSSP